MDSWNHLKCQWEGREDDLIQEIHRECKHQDKLEEDGYRSPSWRVLRALNVAGEMRKEGRGKPGIGMSLEFQTVPVPLVYLVVVPAESDSPMA